MFAQPKNMSEVAGVTVICLNSITKAAVSAESLTWTQAQTARPTHSFVHAFPFSCSLVEPNPLAEAGSVVASRKLNFML